MLKSRPKKAGNRLEEKTGMTRGPVRGSRRRSPKRHRLRREEVDLKVVGIERKRKAEHKSFDGMRLVAAETRERESAVSAAQRSREKRSWYIAHGLEGDELPLKNRTSTEEKREQQRRNEHGANILQFI